MTETYYRYETQRYSVVVDADADLFDVSPPELRLTTHRVVKKTPRGVKLDNGRLICAHWHKKWAHSTLEEAMAGIIARRERHARILKSKLARVEEDLQLLKSGKAVAPAPYDDVEAEDE